MSHTTTPQTSTVLVAGATGYMGGHILRALAAQGCRVRALGRSEERLAAVADACDETFVGEATRHCRTPSSASGDLTHTGKPNYHN